MAFGLCGSGLNSSNFLGLQSVGPGPRLLACPLAWSSCEAGPAQQGTEEGDWKRRLQQHQAHPKLHTQLLA